MRSLFKALLISAALLMALPVFSCGESTEGNPVTATSGAEAIKEPAEDGAARLAAQTQLRNAQSAQELYFGSHAKYAPSLAELKTVNSRLSSKIRVVRGTAEGYEMTIEANNAVRTVFVVRKTGQRVERLDDEGNSW